MITPLNIDILQSKSMQVMEKNGWTPVRLFQELGSEGSHGIITKEKLEDKVGEYSPICHKRAPVTVLFVG